MAKNYFCTCRVNHTEENSVYRLLNITGHIEGGFFKEDDSPDGDGTVFCVECDKPVKGIKNHGR